MVNFYVYSFSIAAIPLLLGVLLIWFGKKLWKKANAENAKYRQRYSGRTTLRVIGVRSMNGRKGILMNQVKSFMSPAIPRFMSIW